MAASSVRKAETAGPRPRVPRARDLTNPKIAATRDAIAGVVGKALTAFSLAEIVVLQKDSDLREETPMFDDPECDAKRPWQTFANFTDSAPNKAVTAPVTFATDVKMGLTALFIGLTDLVNSVGKLPPGEPLAPLVASRTREGNIVHLMVAVEDRMKPHLRVDPMNCELGYPMVLRQKLTALVDDKRFVDPGAEPLARLYLNFLKAIAWHAAVIAYEHEHLTLNRATLFAIIAQMAATVPETEMHVVRDVLGFVRAQIEKWDHAQAQVRAAKNKRPPTKTSPAKSAPANGKRTKGPPSAREAPAAEAHEDAREAPAAEAHEDAREQKGAGNGGDESPDWVPGDWPTGYADIPFPLGEGAPALARGGTLAGQ